MGFSTEVLTGNPLEPYHHPRATVFSHTMGRERQDDAERYLAIGRASCRVYISSTILIKATPVEQLTLLLLGCHVNVEIHTYREVHMAVAMTYEHSRLAKKVNTGKRATRMKSAEGSYFRLIFLRQLSWDMLRPKCTNVIKHCTCAVKWASLGRYHQFDSGPTLCP